MALIPTSKTRYLLLPLLSLGISTLAIAVAPGGTLYIKTDKTKLLPKADATAKADGAPLLKIGEAVKWKGADPGNKQFHQIEVNGKTGYVLQQNLSASAPSPEFLAKDKGQAIDAQAFASSGAATKALSEAALKYAGEKPDVQTLTKGILTAESVAAKTNAKELSK
jgi:hypothetical protein